LRYSRGTDQFILVVAGLFLLGTVLGSVVLYFRIAPLLNRLDYFENTLVNAAETDVYHPIEIKREYQENLPLFAAYNHLSRRLIESNTTMMKYVGFLHHEINSLLASVVGYGHMFAEPKLRPPDADLQEYGRVIVQQTQRITRLVDDFTLAAELEGNQFAPTMMPVRLGPLLNAVVSEVREESQRQGFTREIALIQPAEQALVLGDALSLQNALLKVIQNAVKFSPDGAAVTVRVEVQKLPGRVQVHVQDGGIGIAAEDQGSLFRPFSRIRNEATRRIPGNGMGLFIAQAIVRAHHGEISVQSEPGKGSIFTISLPLEGK
jgi:signal transduction histidine kinase